MAWEHLDIDKPHLAYMILGGFTGLFMLCSLFVKEKLYIGEATVATLCGIIFGPHAANLFNPSDWGNVDKITLECSRIVLVVQCFAVGVELPKAYMERHWKSVCLLLVPVMTWGWLVTSLFIWWMVPKLTWLESLICSACVTATDPVLASSVVGKGKFAKRVPKHLRDLLSAESGCNDGMAFPFIYLSFYILRYRPDRNEVALNWICVTILYECIVGAIFGFMVGYLARHSIKLAERRGLIDRESFLVFYFVLAVFCAGSGSLLGMDDLLIGFAAGVGFSNDGWFTEKTEQSHVSNVIDLLLNLAFFVYFGAVIPWEDFNAPELGLVPWRLVVIALLVIFFRRIPIMLCLKPIIPDVKTWREALFAGHFGPIGVGAIFASILARAELENDSTQPLPASDLSRIGMTEHPEFYNVIQLIWPITTFIIISSILVHGSSIAVFTLGKRINTMTVTLSYTTANEEGPSWMNRLPRVQSIAKGSMSFRKPEEDESSPEPSPEYPPGTLPPIGVPGNFLRRVREEDADSPSVKSPRRRKGRRRDRDSIGGPISQSAIAPQRASEAQGKEEQEQELEERDRIEREASPPTRERDRFGREPIMEVYLEGKHMIVEDEEGNVLKTEDISHKSPEEQQQHIQDLKERLENDRSGEVAKSLSQPHAKTEGEEIQHAVDQKAGGPFQKTRERLGRWAGFGKGRRVQEAEQAAEDSEKAEADADAKKAAEKKKKTEKSGKGRSAHAYQFGNTIIVEDEDGEVLKKYSIPSASTEQPQATKPVRRGLTRMGTWLGKEEQPEPSKDTPEQKKAKRDEWMADDGLRFIVSGNEDVESHGVKHKGHRMDKHEFIRQIQNLGPKARRDMVQESDAPEAVKGVAEDQLHAADRHERRKSLSTAAEDSRELSPKAVPRVQGDEAAMSDSTSSSEEDRADHDVPGDNVAASLARFTRGSSAQERRSALGGRDVAPTEQQPPSTRLRARRDSEDDGTARVPPSELRQAAGLSPVSERLNVDDTGETPAERRRRLAALGEINNSDSEGSDDDAAIVDDEDDDEDEASDSERRPSRIQFADGTKPADSENGNGSGNSSSEGSSSRHHRPRISWAR